MAYKKKVSGAMRSTQRTSVVRISKKSAKRLGQTKKPTMLLLRKTAKKAVKKKATGEILCAQRAADRTQIVTVRATKKKRSKPNRTTWPGPRIEK